MAVSFYLLSFIAFSLSGGYISGGNAASQADSRSVSRFYLPPIRGDFRHSSPNSYLVWDSPERFSQQDVNKFKISYKLGSGHNWACAEFSPRQVRCNFITAEFCFDISFLQDGRQYIFKISYEHVSHRWSDDSPWIHFSVKDKLPDICERCVISPPDISYNLHLEEHLPYVYLVWTPAPEHQGRIRKFKISYKRSTDWTWERVYGYPEDFRCPPRVGNGYEDFCWNPCGLLDMDVAYFANVTYQLETGRHWVEYSKHLMFRIPRCRDHWQPPTNRLLPRGQRGVGTFELKIQNGFLVWTPSPFGPSCSNRNPLFQIETRRKEPAFNFAWDVQKVRGNELICPVDTRIHYAPKMCYDLRRLGIRRKNLEIRVSFTCLGRILRSQIITYGGSAEQKRPLPLPLDGENDRVADPCNEVMDGHSVCSASSRHFYFDKVEKICKPLTRGLCGRGRNNFDSLAKCLEVCVNPQRIATPIRVGAARIVNENVKQPPLPLPLDDHASERFGRLSRRSSFYNRWYTLSYSNQQEVQGPPELISPGQCLAFRYRSAVSGRKLLEAALCIRTSGGIPICDFGMELDVVGGQERCHVVRATKPCDGCFMIFSALENDFLRDFTVDVYPLGIVPCNIC